MLRAQDSRDATWLLSMRKQAMSWAGPLSSLAPLIQCGERELGRPTAWEEGKLHTTAAAAQERSGSPRPAQREQTLKSG